MGSILLYWITALVGFIAIQKIFQDLLLRQFSRTHQCQLPPRHFAYDIIGIAFPINIAQNFQKGGLLDWTRQLFKHYHGTFLSTILGQDYVFTCHPQNIKHILTVQFTEFDVAVERIQLFKHLSSRGILTLDGDTWTASREQLRRQFSQYRSMVDLRMLERHIQQFLNKLPDDGESVDMQEIIGNLALDSLSEFVLGESVNSLSVYQSAENREFTSAIRHTKDTIAKKGFAGPFHWVVGGTKFRKACTTIRRHIQRFTLQALKVDREKHADKAANSNYCLVQSLAIEERNIAVLGDQLSNVLVAGVDAMTSLLSATIWFLARDERVSSILRSEIIGICGSSLATYDQLKNMKYLRCVINEALRLLPPVTFDMRTANTNTILPRGGGKHGEEKIMVKKGQRVVFSSYSAHRWEDIYGQDSDKFRPERWEGIKVNNPGYLPFHVGPRSCPGQQFALTATSYQLARIFQTFPRIVSKDVDEWKENISMTLGNQKGVIVSLFRE